MRGGIGRTYQVEERSCSPKLIAQYAGMPSSGGGFRKSHAGSEANEPSAWLTSAVLSLSFAHNQIAQCTEFHSRRRASPKSCSPGPYVRRALCKSAHGGLSLSCAGTACTFASAYPISFARSAYFSALDCSLLGGFELVGFGRFRLGNHAEPVLRHLLPNGPFVWVAGNPRHPLALLRVSAILIWLAHRVSVGIKASSDWNAGGRLRPTP